MKNCALMPVGTPGASQGGTLVIEQFLMENYRFRRNILSPLCTKVFPKIM